MPRQSGYTWETDWPGPFISYITTPGNTPYTIKDEVARVHIEDLYNLIASITGGAVIFRGKTTTELHDGDTTSPIVVDGNSVTPTVGMLVIYGSKQFIWGPTDNPKWNELGDLSLLGDLAYANTASASYTPAGSVTGAQFTGSQSSVTITATDNTSGNYQPKGTVSISGVEGAATTFSGSYTPQGSVSVTITGTSSVSGGMTTAAAASGKPANYKPEGSISQATFSGNTLTSTGPYTPAGDINLVTGTATWGVSVASGTTTYQPEGSVSAPTISLATAGATTTIQKISTIGKPVSGLLTAAPGATAPANAITYYDVPTGTETLRLYQIGASTANAISTASGATVKTGDASYTASTPSFTGTAVRLVASGSHTTGATFSGSSATISVSGDPSGTISTQSFTGTGVVLTPSVNVPNTLSGSFSGTAATIKTSGVPNISGATATFTGTKVQLSGVTTAAGSVSSATFTGTPATITVSPN